MKMGKPFRCPNCNKEMVLVWIDEKIKLKRHESVYDVWSCLDCSHIYVLDWRN